jgi:uncharacterized membrane protein (DUF4010 family)
MFSEFLVGMGLSLLLGALLGVQREIRQQTQKRRDFAGFRTYTFITLFGYLIGYLSFGVFDSVYIFPVALFGVFILVALAYYTISKYNKKEIGMISGVVALLAFLVGIMISLEFYQISIAVAIAITTILFLGNKLHSFAKNLTHEEIFATLKFAIISLVVLPLLPNKNYSPLDFPLLGELLKSQGFIPIDILAGLDIFNFYYLWLMVVFISGIAYVGYILMKTIGAEKGILVTGFLGGFMSSTALTSSFSIESKKYNSLSWPLAVGVIIACSVMFFRMLFEVLILNSDLFWELFFSLGLMGSCGIILGVYLYLKKDKYSRKIKEIDVDSPFSIKPALKFAGLFLGVLFVTKLLTLIFGNSGIYLVSFVSGITDVDAITISLSKLALEGAIPNGVAQFGMIIAAFANTFFKVGIAYYLGSKNLFRIVLLVFGFILFVGGLSLLV